MCSGDAYPGRKAGDFIMRHEPAATFEDDLSECRRLLSTGSRTFYAASFLLPRRIREPASALYAFCRLADDAVDDTDLPAEGVSRLEDRLDRAYNGRPVNIAADRAFAATVKKFDIPRAIPQAMLEGFAWDASERRYETIEDVQAYAARVAGTVGAMMAVLMGRRSPEDLARATDLGIAMQLTNIARDVGEDARNGRLYLPRAWFKEEGLDPDEWLLDPQFTPAISNMVTRILALASSLYERSALGIAQLPADCRPGIYAARYLYAEIGKEIERRGNDSITQRAVVAPSRKVQLLLRAVAATPSRRDVSHEAAVSEAEFLVAAAARNPELKTVSIEDVPWWDMHGKVLVLLEIFHRLEERQRVSHRRTLGRGDAVSFGAEAAS
jgi:15-cis-phytoene synthase